MANFLARIIQSLADIGLVDVIIPFLFAFTIVFAILQKTRVLGSENKKPKVKLNTVFALVAAFFFILSAERTKLFTDISRTVSLLMLGIIMLLLILGILGVKSDFFKNSITFVIVLMILGLIVATSLGWVQLSDIADWLFQPVMLGILTFIFVIWFMLREPGKQVKRPSPSVTGQRSLPATGPQKVTSVSKKEIEKALREKEKILRRG